MDSGSREKGAEFAQFDMVPLAEDHHYIKTSHSKCFSDSNASVYAEIMKEWKILEKSLPESIYVQVYETRIDLLRAVIIGPAGTPYHDGLFFFDIALPSDYPESPPKVYYHSHGYHLNPNLYNCGYVCLSLINTWSGSKDERWLKKSTILQILVSIQGLVLNERPFFNEPGNGYGAHSKEAIWVNQSIDYNEEVFVLSCKTMLQIMKQPPKNFEEFVVQHFRGRAEVILVAIEQYRKGRVLVGRFLVRNGAEKTCSVRVSARFKANLASIQPMLKEAFARIGCELSINEAFGRIGCEPNKALAKTVEDVEKGRQHKRGILRKLCSFAKKVWKSKSK